MGVPTAAVLGGGGGGGTVTTMEGVEGVRGEERAWMGDGWPT